MTRLGHHLFAVVVTDLPAFGYIGKFRLRLQRFAQGSSRSHQGRPAESRAIAAGIELLPTILQRPSSIRIFAHWHA